MGSVWAQVAGLVMKRRALEGNGKQTNKYTYRPKRCVNSKSSSTLRNRGYETSWNILSVGDKPGNASSVALKWLAFHSCSSGRNARPATEYRYLNLRWNHTGVQYGRSIDLIKKKKESPLYHHERLESRPKKKPPFPQIWRSCLSQWVPTYLSQ